MGCHHIPLEICVTPPFSEPATRLYIWFRPSGHQRKEAKTAQLTQPSAGEVRKMFSEEDKVVEGTGPALCS